MTHRSRSVSQLCSNFMAKMIFPYFPWIAWIDPAMHHSNTEAMYRLIKENTQAIRNSTSYRKQTIEWNVLKYCFCFCLPWEGIRFHYDHSASAKAYARRNNEHHWSVLRVPLQCNHGWWWFQACRNRWRRSHATPNPRKWNQQSIKPIIDIRSIDIIGESIIIFNRKNFRQRIRSGQTQRGTVWWRYHTAYFTCGTWNSHLSILL